MKSKISSDEKFLFFDFREKYINKYYSSYKEAIETIKEDLSRVLVYIVEGQGYFIKKDDMKEKLYNIIKKKQLNEIVFNMYVFNEQKKKHENCSLAKLINMFPKSIATYKYIKFKPEKDVESDRIFNLWKGYNSKIVEKLI